MTTITSNKLMHQTNSFPINRKQDDNNLYSAGLPLFFNDFKLVSEITNEGTVFKIFLTLIEDLPFEEIFTEIDLGDSKEFCGVTLSDKVFLPNRVFSGDVELSSDHAGLSFLSDDKRKIYSLFRSAVLKTNGVEKYFKPTTLVIQLLQPLDNLFHK